ncbi:hypothetical protein OS31_40290 [Dickeya oryzae]
MRNNRNPPLSGFFIPLTPTTNATEKINKNAYFHVDDVIKNVYNGIKLNGQEEAVKQSEFRRWLAEQGAEFKDGTNHLKIYLNSRQTVMPRHPGKEIPEPLRKAILKQLGLK